MSTITSEIKEISVKIIDRERVFVPSLPAFIPVLEPIRYTPDTLSWLHHTHTHRHTHTHTHTHTDTHTHTHTYTHTE